MGIFETYVVEADSMEEAEDKATRGAYVAKASGPYAQSAFIYIRRIDDPDELEAK